MGNPYRGQGRVLKLLKLKPETTQKELSDLLDMRPQSLGDLLNILEQIGYITRRPSENDKRAMMIRLTEKGANEEIGDEKQLGFDSLFNCLSEEEQARLREYLKRIIDDWRGDTEHDFGFGFHDFYHRHR
jgi:DNA-binding MarR family transcriptional regulator